MVQTCRYAPPWWWRHLSLCPQRLGASHKMMRPQREHAPLKNCSMNLHPPLGVHLSSISLLQSSLRDSRYNITQWFVAPWRWLLNMNYSNEASPFQLLNLFSYFLRLTLIRHVHVTASLHLDVFVKLCKGDVATKGGGCSQQHYEVRCVFFQTRAKIEYLLDSTCIDAHRFHWCPML